MCVFEPYGVQAEIEALIAGSGRKTSAFLQLAKETSARAGELLSLKWTDLDQERNTLRIVAEKNSNPRILGLSSKCVGMLQSLPRKNERIFGSTYNAMMAVFGHTRRRVAAKLKNPRLLQIHFHTFRHWKATTLYHRTKDPLFVMQFLGHKKIDSTLLYIQLEQVMYREDSDEFSCKVAKTIDEVKQLIEAGFEYVCDMQDVKIFRRRK